MPGSCSPGSRSPHHCSCWRTNPIRAASWQRTLEPWGSPLLGLVSVQSLANLPILLVMENGRKERNPLHSPCHITACPSLTIHRIRSFIVIRPNKSFADGCRSSSPETLPPSLPRFSLQTPFLQSRKHHTVPETSSPIWCPASRASRARAVQLWVRVPGTAAAAAVP